MEEDGLIDATNFIECQMIYHPELDNEVGLYAAPVCIGNGVEIGVYTDEFVFNWISRNVSKIT